MQSGPGTRLTPRMRHYFCNFASGAKLKAMELELGDDLKFLRNGVEEVSWVRVGVTCNGGKCV